MEARLGTESVMGWLATTSNIRTPFKRSLQIVHCSFKLDSRAKAILYKSYIPGEGKHIRQMVYQKE